MKKKDLILIAITIVLILGITIFAIEYWNVVYSLLSLLISKTELVKDFIQGYGWISRIVLFLIIVSCFFFPVISSLPAQIALGMTYGLLEGSIIVSLAFFTASQIYYLIRKDINIIRPKRQIKEKELKEKINNSSVNIHVALLIAYIAPFIPFILISSLAYDGLKKYWQYFLYTLIGPIGEVVFTLYFGNKILTSNPTASFISLIVIIIFCGLSLFMKDKIINLIFKPKKEVIEYGE